MDLPQDFIDVLNAVTNKRARFVIDTILKNGYCSTEDLKNGGYEHAPRAARDVPLALRPVAFYDIVLRSHLVTCNRNDYGSALCCRMPPDIRIPIDMHDYNREF